MTIGDWEAINGPTEYWHELVTSSSDIWRAETLHPRHYLRGRRYSSRPCKGRHEVRTPKRNTAVSAKDWATIFTRCLEEGELLDDPYATTLCHLLIRLVWTDPTVAFDSGRWANQKLLVATDTNAWMAVYQMMGCPWKTVTNGFQTTTTKQKTKNLRKTSPTTSPLQRR